MKYFAANTEKNETKIFQQLAQSTGYTYLSEDSIGLSTKICGMFDFGLSKIPLQKIVFGDFLKCKVYFFESVDKPISTGHHGKIIPTWSVCLLELPEKKTISGLMYFHKNITFGKLKHYKSFPPEWGQFKIDITHLKNYMVILNKSFDIESLHKIVDIFSQYKKQFKGKLVPRELTLQINNRYIAVYSDLWNFDKSEDYLKAYDLIKKIYDVVK